LQFGHLAHSILIFELQCVEFILERSLFGIQHFQVLIRARTQVAAGCTKHHHGSQKDAAHGHSRTGRAFTDPMWQVGNEKS
jgi:hypothetical protein